MEAAGPEALLIKGARIIDPAQKVDAEGDILLSLGKVSWIAYGEASRPHLPPHCLVLDARGLVASPGFVDIHCHLREPGYEEKETIATGTRAAARGGFTTVCCMPNTNPPIDNRGVVELVYRKAREEGVVRVLPIGCVSKGRLGKELAEMGELADAGVVAYSDDGSPVADSSLMRRALEYSRAFGLPVVDHCEDVSLSTGGLMNEGLVSTRLGLKGIPNAAEEVAVARDILLAQLTGGRLHIAHVSTTGSVDLIRRAKESGLQVTAEATPHHLTMSDEWVMGRGASPLIYDTSTKVNPPLRTRMDIEALIQGLKDGVIDAIATDHAPHTMVDKLCEYEVAASGISVFETALGSLMSLVHQGKLDLVTLLSKLTFEPAKIIGRSSQMGTLQAGAAGDVTIFDPNAEWRVDASQFVSRGKHTPLDGCVLKGRVMATVVGGEIVYKDEALKMKKAGEAPA